MLCRASKRRGERRAVRERESMCASRGGAKALKVSSFPGEGEGIAIPILQIASAIS